MKRIITIEESDSREDVAKTFADLLSEFGLSVVVKEKGLEVEYTVSNGEANLSNLLFPKNRTFLDAVSRQGCHGAVSHPIR